jgi:hypothetical protein
MLCLRFTARHSSSQRALTRHFCSTWSRNLTSQLTSPTNLISNSGAFPSYPVDSDNLTAAITIHRLQSHRHFTTTQKAMAPQYSKDDFKISSLYDVKDKGEWG